MSLVNPPAHITAIKDKLDACAGKPAGITYHYPTAAGTTAPPYAVITAENVIRERFAEGSSSFLSGDGSIVLHLSGFTIGQVEALAETLCEQMASNPVGLIINDPQAGLSSEPPIPNQDENGNEIANDPSSTISIEINFSFGIGA